MADDAVAVQAFAAEPRQEPAFPGAGTPNQDTAPPGVVDRPGEVDKTTTPKGGKGHGLCLASSPRVACR